MTSSVYQALSATNGFGKTVTFFLVVLGRRLRPPRDVLEGPYPRMRRRMQPLTVCGMFPGERATGNGMQRRGSKAQRKTFKPLKPLKLCAAGLAFDVARDPTLEHADSASRGTPQSICQRRSRNWGLAPFQAFPIRFGLPALPRFGFNRSSDIDPSTASWRLRTAEYPGGCGVANR